MQNPGSVAQWNKFEFQTWYFFLLRLMASLCALCDMFLLWTGCHKGWPVLVANLKLLSGVMIAMVFGMFPHVTGAQDSDVPIWLQRHVGLGDGKIAPIVLERARALHQRKIREGHVVNPCYFAMDATRPNSIDGAPGRRFYVICEATKSFRTFSSGHGNGRKLQRANFRNGRQCATHFSNAEGSNLTAGGSYVTAETRNTFKGYFSSAGERVPFNRTFLILDGEGETSNARVRDIGGHQAVFLKSQCRFHNPGSPYADADGYVPFGRLVNYTGGRSNGCTTWSPAASDEIISLAQGQPTTLYIYPESKDIYAVSNAVKSGRSLSRAGLYWNARCLQAIGSPKFWPKENLQPVIN
ncbi:MAG: hypothetical protein AAF666_21145, partial [Pseudomonadota bacterium]